METNNNNNNNYGRQSQSDAPNGLNQQEERDANTEKQRNPQRNTNKNNTDGSNPDIADNGNLENPTQNAEDQSGRQDDISGRGYETDNDDAQKQEWRSDDMAPNREYSSGQGEERRAYKRSVGKIDADSEMKSENSRKNTNKLGSENYGADVDHTADSIG